MRRQLQLKNLSLFSAFAAVCLSLACGTPTTNTNGNTMLNANVNTNANAMNANISNMNAAINQGATIETKEPDQYQATVTLKFEMSGAQNAATPPLKAEVARNGADRRMEFVMPNGDKIIYLDSGGKQFVVSPNRKQYAELTADALGFEVRKLLMPEQIVNQVKTLQGVERVGEEKFGDRDVVKYRYGSTTDTKSNAGTIATESVVLVDKETSLPLRSVTNAQSQNGNVQGIQGVNLVTEINNIRTNADASLFAPPTDFARVEPEQIKQQVDMIFNAAAALIGQMMKSAQPANSPNQ